LLKKRAKIRNIRNSREIEIYLDFTNFFCIFGSQIQILKNMKKTGLCRTSFLLILFLVYGILTFAQIATYTYQLSGDFHSQPYSVNDLVQIPNNSGDTGTFLQRPVPASTCGQQGNASGYFFNDDAGLQFNNPSGFIGNTYSIAFNFQIDELISPPAWVRILSFTHTDDHGIYIKLTNPPTNGTLEFWPNGTVGPNNFFTTVDFYQLILVRDDAGLIKIYVNGTEFDTYDDSQTQDYVPKSPGNYIIWFRDDPSVLANEASPGFVQNIIIANYAWTPTKVVEIWERFCSSLLGVSENTVKEGNIYPNPANNSLYLEMGEKNNGYTASIIDITGQELLLMENTKTPIQVFDISHFNPGIYFLKVVSEDKSRVYRFIKK
jgi:hypothetical protein